MSLASGMAMLKKTCPEDRHYVLSIWGSLLKLAWNARYGKKVINFTISLLPSHRQFCWIMAQIIIMCVDLIEIEDSDYPKEG